MSLENLKTEAFLSGQVDLYNVVCKNPKLYMIPIGQLVGVRQGLKQLGYRIRVRYRGPRRALHNRDTLKKHARAFTVYFNLNR